MTTITFGLRNLSMAEERQNQSVLERHFQSIVSGLALVGIIWVASTMSTLTTDVAVLKTTVDSLGQQMARASSDRFTGVDGKRLERQILTLESDMRKMDDRLRKLEAR